MSACGGYGGRNGAAAEFDGGLTGSGFQIATTSLPTGVLAQEYVAALAAQGGVAPYTWSIAAGQLPGGLSLNGANGQITGTPNQAGTFSATLKVSDVDSEAQSKTFSMMVASSALDAYGGTVQFSCPNGPAPHFYVQKVNSRWWMCTPAGNGFWLRGVYHVDASDNTADYQGIMQDGPPCATPVAASPNAPCSMVVAKYGDASANWGAQTVRRMTSWGFNATDEYSSPWVEPTATNSAWNTPDNTIPAKVPFTGMVWPSQYARNANKYAQPVKDIVGPINPNVYGGYRAPSPDVFDPNLGLWMVGELSDPANIEYVWAHGPHNDYFIGYNVDDTDTLYGFGAGPDFPTLSNGVPDSGTGNWQPHLGWMVLITPPTQSSGLDGDGNPITYSDTQVYSKTALSNWLSQRYSGNIQALNQAWGSSYSTFGSNGGWGNGTGLLDEDGTHGWVPKDPYGLSGATPAMQADLDAFLLYYAQQYFSVIKNAIQTAAPGVMYLGVTNIGTWSAPPRRQILQAAGQYMDVISMTTIPTGCSACTDDQQRVDFVAQYGGDKPWTLWEGWLAQPDSYMSVYPMASQAQTQGQRAQQFQAMVTGLLNSADTATGTQHVVGYKWWQLYDDRGEQANWGFMTRRDNAYDGVSAVMAVGVDAWGFSTGGEQANYGNFIGGVTTANVNVYKSLLGLP